MSGSKTELVTRSKRPGMDCTIDIFHEKTVGFSKNINDRSTYKLVLVDEGSFVVEEDGKYRVVVAPAGIALNEKAEFKVVSENGVKARTTFFKPSVIREEFTIDAINSGKFDKFLSAVKSTGEMTYEERLRIASFEDTKFEDCFTSKMVYQDALLLLDFIRPDRNIVYYSLMRQVYDSLRGLTCSIAYDIQEQPDNFWILRARHFLCSTLFLSVADFYRPYRQYEVYRDPFVANVARYLWENISEEITLDSVLKEFSVNKNTLNDAFNKELDMSCMSYLEHLRIGVAKSGLQYSDEPVSEISVNCGYSDTNYFSKVFKKHTGMTPSDFRKNMKGLC
ncbi:MAG: AraC family transcriptional regulator [Clostridiales bacterium]|nr:AraC family transcriptional regulator [Clostridiales bacterium]